MMNFDQAQSLYAELRRSLDAGTITPATFSERVMGLRCQDEQGNWWQVDAQSGGWLRWNGQVWVSAPSPSATPAAPTMGAAGTPQNLLQYLVFVGRQMVAGYLKRLPLMLALAAGIWVLHTYWLVFVNDGFGKIPSNFFLKNLILLTGNKVQAAVAWGLLGMVVSTIVCRCYRKGTATAIRELVCWPETARQALAGGGPRGMSLFLVACAVALAISGWLSNPLAALPFAFMLSLGLLDRDASPFFVGVRFGWNDLDRTLLKGKVVVPSASAAAAVIVLGAAAGFLLGGFLPKLLLNIGCVVVLIVAFAGKFRTPASGGAGRLFLLLFLVVLPTLCWGDDGGWSESGATFKGWLHNQGFLPAVLLGFWPASLASFFGILPWVMPPSGPSENPMTISGTGTTDNRPDIEWTGPDGVNRVLVWHPEHNGYINILTGGLVDPNDIDTWKRNIIETKQKTDDYRTHNKELTDSGQDAQTQALNQIKKEAEERARILQTLGRMESVVFGGAASDLPVPPGGPGNILDNISKVANDIASGKPIDHQKLDAIGKLYKDDVKGNILLPNQMPQPGEADSGVLTETIKQTINEVSTCSNENGISWKGVAVRFGLGILTGGVSESPFSMHNYVQNGGNSIVGGFVAGVEGLAVGEIVGGALGVAGKGLAASGEVAGELAGEVGTAVKAAAEAGNPVATALVKGASTASEGISAASEALAPVSEALTRAKNILTTEIKVPDSLKKALGGASEAEGTVVAAATKAERQVADSAANVEGSIVSKPVSASDAAANKAARVKACTEQTGEGQYNVNSDPSVNVNKQMGGMTTPAKKQIQITCDKYGVKIDVRSTTKYAHDPLAQGTAVPKPEFCKSKTINTDDIHLGAKEKDLGLVGYFKPKKPVQGSMPPEDYERVMERYKQRLQEHKDQSSHMIELEAEGKACVKDGVVFNSKLPNGKPFTGDYDLFEIRDAVTNKPLPRYQLDPQGNVIFNPPSPGNSCGTPKLNPVREQIIKDLQQPPFNVQHGSHMDWKYDHVSHEVPPGAPAGARSEFEIKQGIDMKIRGQHTSTAKNPDALITFGADQKPIGSWFESIEKKS